MKEEEESPKLCSSCGERGVELRRCSRCHTVWYCNPQCQKKDWKQHKKQCFPPDSTCTRCLEKILPGTDCKVPHPEYLLQDTGSMFGRDTTLSLHCGACNASFSKSTTGRRYAADTQWTYHPTSSKCCYQGPHTVKPLPDNDNRRVANDIVAIIASPDVQEQIDSIPTAVRILSIKSSGVFDDSVKPTFNLTLPSLEELILIDVSFGQVRLDSNQTPKLRKLELQNIPDDCDIRVDCPSLEHFDMRYFHGHCNWIDAMLLTATNLQTFRSYKLGVDSIHFASNKLTEIHLHRSDVLGHVSLWAPRLEYLRLQGCYSLERVDILDVHETLSKELPPGFRKTVFLVETTNSCLSPQIVRALDSHPRVEWNGEEEDEYAGVGGCGMESMFMNMHRSMG